MLMGAVANCVCNRLPADALHVVFIMPINSQAELFFQSFTSHAFRPGAGRT